MKRVPKAKKPSTPRKKTTAAKKTKTLKKMSLADGKMEVSKVRELEEILGVDQMNVFRTNDIEVFKENISEMSLSDLQSLAAEAGVFPGGNKMTLKNRLEKEFINQEINYLIRTKYNFIHYNPFPKVKSSSIDEFKNDEEIVTSLSKSYLFCKIFLIYKILSASVLVLINAKSLSCAAFFFKYLW